MTLLLYSDFCHITWVCPGIRGKLALVGLVIKPGRLGEGGFVFENLLLPSNAVVGNKHLPQPVQRVRIKIDGIDFHIHCRFHERPIDDGRKGFSA